MNTQEAQKKLISCIAALSRGNEQEQAQVRQLAQQGDEIAAQAVSIFEAASQNDPKASQIVAQVEQMIDSQNNSNMYYAKNGAKLNYLRQLSGQCPEGYEITYLKSGGKGFIKRCKKCEEGNRMSAVEEFKCGGKKKVKKGEKGISTSKPKVTKSNTDGGYEIEVKYPNGKTDVANYDSKGIVGGTNQKREFFNRYNSPQRTDSLDRVIKRHLKK